MATLTFREICDAIKSELSALVTSGDVERVLCYYELTEGMNTLPTIEIVPESWSTSPPGETDRYTFGAGTECRSRTDSLIHIDLYARQRSQLDEDWESAVDIADLIQTELESQCTCPIFGLAGLKDMRWEATRVVFERAEARYTGFRFALTVRTY